MMHVFRATAPKTSYCTVQQPCCGSCSAIRTAIRLVPVCCEKLGYRDTDWPSMATVLQKAEASLFRIKSWQTVNIPCSSFHRTDLHSLRPLFWEETHNKCLISKTAELNESMQLFRVSVIVSLYNTFTKLQLV